MQRRERRARKAGTKPPPRRRFPFRKGTEPLPHIATGVMETMEVRRMRALDLRLSGLTFRQIAKAIGCSKDTAWEDVHAELSHVIAEKAILAEKVFEMEVERLDAVQHGAWKAATGGKDPDAARVVLKCIDMRCRLFGLYAEQPTGAVGDRGYVPAGNASGIINVTPEATWHARIDDTRKRLAAAEVAAIDWAAFEHAGVGTGDLAPPRVGPTAKGDA